VVLDGKVLFDELVVNESELDDGLRRDFDVGDVLRWHRAETAVETAQDSLVADDERGGRLLLEALDDGLKTSDDILVALTLGVSVAELVLLTRLELLGEVAFDLLVREAVADADANLLEFPPALDDVAGDGLSGLDGALHGARPDVEGLLGVLKVLADPVAEAFGEALAALGEAGVSAESLVDVVLALTVADEEDGLRQVEVLFVERHVSRVDLHCVWVSGSGLLLFGALLCLLLCLRRCAACRFVWTGTCASVFSGAVLRFFWSEVCVWGLAGGEAVEE